MSMPQVNFDHLVVAARDLDEGVAWVQDRLGVTVPFGGVHAHMGTHNCVGRLTETTFLEIIAINPADTPDRPRWFSMDTTAFQNRINAEGAFLHHWVINSSDIEASLATASHDAGPAIAMRRAALEWQISVRPDGVLPEDGILPTIIQWPDIPHPAAKMGDLGLKLAGLDVLTRNPKGIARDLAALGADGFCTVHAADMPGLSARFTKDGRTVTL